MGLPILCSILGLEQLHYETEYGEDGIAWARLEESLCPNEGAWTLP